MYVEDDGAEGRWRAVSKYSGRMKKKKKNEFEIGDAILNCWQEQTIEDEDWQERNKAEISSLLITGRTKRHSVNIETKGNVSLKFAFYIEQSPSYAQVFNPFFL